MRLFFGVLAAVFSFSFHGQVAGAVEVNAEPISLLEQDVKEIEVVPDEADRVAAIRSEWDISEFTRENGFPTGECIMRATYDNDLEITFKAKSGQLSAVRVRDLNAGVSSRVKGFLALGLDKSSYGLSSKSTQGQIDASLLTVPAPAEKISDLDKYRLRIGTQDYHFSTEGFAYAYQELLRCHGYENARTLQVVSTPRAIPVILEPEMKAKTSQDDVPEMPAEPIDLVALDPLNEDEVLDEAIDSLKANIVDENLSVRMETWRADKGDKLSATLEAWAVQAGVKPEINLTNDVSLDRDFKIFGPLDIAVNELLKETIGENTTSAYIENGNGNVTTIDEQTKAPKQVNAASLRQSMNRIKWRALQGTDLRKVLKRWSAKEKVEFIWDADQTFLVKKTMKAMADYNGAVASILGQYSDQSVKPKGALNIDPDTGRKTLIITTEQSS